jgi:hypothetical protein
MYFEERIIQGCLCWRGRPDAEWTKYSQEELTIRLVDAERALRETNEEGS